MACASARVYPGEVILLDNSLLLWLSVGGSSAHRRLNEYLELLLTLRPGLVAGVISSPQSRLLARLVTLVEAETVEKGIKNGQEIARVEIPAWLAEAPQLVDSIHASLLADSQMTGCSYVLSQAHQHATIPFDLADVLHASARACFWAEAGVFLLYPQKTG